MFWKRKTKATEEDLIPVPAKLPPLAEPDERDDLEQQRRRRMSRWTLGLALAAAAVVLFVLTLSGLGIYSGLKERTESNRLAAQEHYTLGMQHLQAGEYELAVGELELALRYDPDLPDLQGHLQEAQALALSQITPSSETRQGAADALYQQGVALYESGELEQVITVLEELRGVDSAYQRSNVETMLVAAHYQLGVEAVREDLLGEARKHFEAVLALKADPNTQANAQEQLDLLGLYRAAISHWGQDWSAAIQGLKGLYALAPEYKDVRTRLHDAYSLHAQEYADQGEWCLAEQEYTAAVEVFPLEETVDRRDDAAIQCQAAAQTTAPGSTPRAKPTSGGSATPAATPTLAGGGKPVQAATGRIVYPGIEPIEQRHNLYLLDLAQQSPQLLLEDASQPAFSPDGSRLAFRKVGDYPRLGILDLGTNQVSEMTRYRTDSTPTWSPDASQIVFASDRESDRLWRIYVISPNEVRGKGVEWGIGQMPAWAADGSEIAYHACDLFGNNCGLWVMEPGGFDQARLTTDPSDTSPSWKPDASQVAFISSRTGNWEIYTVNVATGQDKRLTNHPAMDVAPAWSPDGKKLVFLSNRDGAWALFVLDIKSGNVQKVVATGGPYADPVSERLAWIP
jgi:tetratricopeptide (TPR) repeat protein